MIKVTVRGSFAKTDRFLSAMKSQKHLSALDKFGPKGVAALSRATPKDRPETYGDWYFKITRNAGYYSIAWHNSAVVNGTPIVIMLQYGHGTGTGGYVQGRDFINPAIRPIFDEMVQEMWKVVTQS